MKELAAIDFAIESFSSLLESSHVKLYTDSQVASQIVDVGSMKPGLHNLAIKIFGACLRSKIKLEIQWIPRTENEKADFSSPLIDVDDYMYMWEKKIKIKKIKKRKEKKKRKVSKIELINQV